MPEGAVHIRRTRRTDFTAVMSLLATSATAVPPPDRAALRRFRNIVNDLGADLYVAVVDGVLAGLVHVTYARQLTVPPAARLDQLVVAADFRRRGVGAALLGFARTRARRRGCADLSCVLPGDGAPARRFLEPAGLHAAGGWFREPLRDE